MVDGFSVWTSWSDRNSIADIGFPGIYICSIPVGSNLIAGNEFSWAEDIVYVGMTNSKNGLKGRLTQFDNTIAGRKGHGGADRVRFRHRNYELLVSRLLVAVKPFVCDVNSNRPEDLELMGEVAKCEYLCFAEYVRRFGRLPEFNDMTRSQKYSLAVGTGG